MGSGISDEQRIGVKGLIHGVKSYCPAHGDNFKRYKWKGQYGEIWSLPDFSTIRLLMARCHLTMCRWWAWGCQQHEAGTTLSLARQLQTSCCYTSSLPQHFISKNTQEGATHSDVKSGEAESIRLDKTSATGQEITRSQRLYRFFRSLLRPLIKLMTQEKDFSIPFIRIVTQTYWKKHDSSLARVPIHHCSQSNETRTYETPALQPHASDV